LFEAGKRPKVLSLCINAFLATIMKKFIRGFLEKGFLALRNGSQIIRHLKVGLRKSNILVYGVLGKVSFIRLVWTAAY
jgi:hypothetical protein